MVIAIVVVALIVAGFLYFRNSKSARAAGEAVVKNAESQAEKKV